MAEVIAPEVAEKINLIHDLDEFEHDEVARAQALESKQQQDKPKEGFRNYTNSTRQERVEKFYKEQHENQTYEFVEEMEKKYAAYNNMNMGIWEALEYLDNLVDNSDPDTDLSQLQHALQTAESMRKKYPGEEYDWFHLTGLIHDLGKILSFKCNEPQWAVVGDTFPVGCAFSDRCVFPQYFDNNPDRHHKTYSTLHGVYQPHCGLSNIKMSWGHDEYLYRVCVENGSTLPTSALYMIRYHSFYPWHQQGAYTHLTNEQDDENLKWVKMFNQFDLYSKADDLKSVEELKPYYQKLIKKYFPDTLRW